jgi:hypothetical protein
MYANAWGPSETRVVVQNRIGTCFSGTINTLPHHRIESLSEQVMAPTKAQRAAQAKRKTTLTAKAAQQARQPAQGGVTRSGAGTPAAPPARVTRRKAPAKKAPAKKTPARKTPVRQRQQQRQQQQDDDGENDEDEDGDEQSDNEGIEAEDQEEPEAMVIDDNDDDVHPLLKGVTNPITKLKIQGMLDEQKRKEELHNLEVRRLEAQLAGTSGPSALPVPEDDYSESSLSPSERVQVLLFPTIPKKHVIAITRNTFDPGNLPYLENVILEDHTSDFNITIEEGKLKQSKNVAKVSAFGKNYSIWSTNFITYVSVVSIFHGVTHPQLVSKLLAFHNLIIDLAKTYDWQKAVLALALLHHRTALQKGFANLIAWEVPANLIDRHCRAHPKSANLPTSSSTSQPGKLTYETNPTNKPGVICRNYNEKGCTSERCNRDHVCSKCKGKHTTKECKVKGDKE